MNQNFSADRRLCVQRVLPDGRRAWVLPFHISLEGLEAELLCRDEEDYDQMVKYIFLCARRRNVIVVIYTVVSSHAHVSVLAENDNCPKQYADDLKKRQSMWLAAKYGCKKILYRTSTWVSLIDTVSYARNALAYVTRNALDNLSGNISKYKWTGFGGMFCDGKVAAPAKPVRNLSAREIRRCFHTHDNLSDVDWLVNENNELEPASTCDWKYLEMIFNHDQSFYLKMIGALNVSEMEFVISGAGNFKMTDSEFLRSADEYSTKWFNKTVRELTPAMKAKLLGYLKRIMRLSIPQVARCFAMDRDTIRSFLK